jgi:hypothetical protein
MMIMDRGRNREMEAMSDGLRTSCHECPQMRKEKEREERGGTEDEERPGRISAATLFRNQYRSVGPI